jgi:hypothetical protein
MGKRATVLDKAIAAIDGKIATLYAAKAELLDQQKKAPARTKKAAPPVGG